MNNVMDGLFQKYLKCLCIKRIIPRQLIAIVLTEYFDLLRFVATTVSAVQPVKRYPVHYKLYEEVIAFFEPVPIPVKGIVLFAHIAHSKHRLSNALKNSSACRRISLFCSMGIHRPRFRDGRWKQCSLSQSRRKRLPPLFRSASRFCGTFLI